MSNSLVPQASELIPMSESSPVNFKGESVPTDATSSPPDETHAEASMNDSNAQNKTNFP